MLQQTSPEALAVGDSVVSFGRGARRGSGFVIGRDRVLTLAYRLRDDVVETVTRDGERNDGRVLGVDRDLGVAVVDVPTGATPALRWASGRKSPSRSITEAPSRSSARWGCRGSARP